MILAKRSQFDRFHRRERRRAGCPPCQASEGQAAQIKRSSSRAAIVFWQNEAKFTKVFKGREPSHFIEPRQTSDVRLLCMGLFFDFLNLRQRRASTWARLFPSS